MPTLGDVPIDEVVRVRAYWNGWEEFFVAAHDYRGTGLTLLVTDQGYGQKSIYWTDLDVGYEGSDLHAWLNGEYLDQLYDMAETVRSVELPCSDLENGGIVTKYCNAKAFALSAGEVVEEWEGYDGPVLQDSQKIRNYYYHFEWWTRSITHRSPGLPQVAVENRLGEFYAVPANAYEIYPRPCIALPPTLNVTKDGEVEPEMPEPPEPEPVRQHLPYHMQPI